MPTFYNSRMSECSLVMEESSMPSILRHYAHSIGPNSFMTPGHIIFSTVVPGSGRFQLI